MQIPIYPILYLNFLSYFQFAKQYDMVWLREWKQNTWGKNMHRHNFQLYFITKEFVVLISHPTSVPKLNKDPLNFSSPLTIMGRERNHSTSNSILQTSTALNNIWEY